MAVAVSHVLYETVYFEAFKNQFTIVRAPKCPTKGGKKIYINYWTICPDHMTKMATMPKIGKGGAVA